MALGIDVGELEPVTDPSDRVNDLHPQAAVADVGPCDVEGHRRVAVELHLTAVEADHSNAGRVQRSPVGCRVRLAHADGAAKDPIVPGGSESAFACSTASDRAMRAGQTAPDGATVRG